MVTHYIVEKRETSRVMWSIVSEKLVDCIINVPRLIQGNEYIFRVRGVNKYGVGDPLESQPVIAKNAFGKQIRLVYSQSHPSYIIYSSESTEISKQLVKCIFESNLIILNL